MTEILDLLESRAARQRALPEPSVRRLIRIDAGATQTDVAAAVGVTAAAVSLWEAGRSEPTGVRLDRYLAVLADLLTLDNQAAPS